jgi:hypothetical protein
LSEKKKGKYKMRCDEMRRIYEQKLADFYSANPELKPVKPEKVKKIHVMAPQPQQVPTIHLPSQPEPVYFQQPMLQATAAQQPVMVYTRAQCYKNFYGRKLRLFKVS